MKLLNIIALTLVIVGALNWLLIGLIEFNLVDTLFGINKRDYIDDNIEYDISWYCRTLVSYILQ